MRRRRLADADHYGGAVSPAARRPRIAVVGATSLIGEALVAELRVRKFPSAALFALDEARDLGRRAGDEEAPLPVGDVAAFDFSQVDLAFFCGRSALSAAYAPVAAAHAWVIDGSAAHRARADVPLVVADVNPGALAAVGAHGLIALPGSASAALATVLAPLHALAGLERVEVATYHAVSGSGRAAMEGLAAETVDMLAGRPARAKVFGRQIAFNALPLVDALEADGVSAEERRIWEETRRVLGLAQLEINVTAVRVPVFFGHSFVVHVKLARALAPAAAADLLRGSGGVEVIDADSREGLPTPAIAALAPDRVYVGRLRADPTRDRALNFWVVGDNVRKCAAHNAVSVAQILVNRAQ